MKAFDFSRFLNVARWDLTINRKFYIRQLVVIAGCVLVPIIINYVVQLYGYWLVSSDMSFAEYRESVASGFYSVTWWVVYYRILLVAALIQMFCYMFHNLVTKQGSISELTLPATNSERFLWHAGCSFFGTLLVFMGSILVADLVHAILGWALFGVTNPQSITLATWDVFSFAFRDLKYTNNIALVCFATFGFLGQLSTFSLGSAFKYRHTFGYVLLFHIALQIVSLLLVGMFGLFVAKNNFDIQIIADLPSWLGAWFLATLAIVIFCLIWWLTYRLYCRAQITTRRNP